jgi:23S rRNA (cytosine1962-C5)-methyltransferase
MTRQDETAASGDIPAENPKRWNAPHSKESPSDTYPRVILLPRRAKPFYGRHPGVYAGAIAAVDGTPADGDVVDLVSHDGHFIARGLFNSRSNIRVRLYSWSPEQPLDAEFFRARIQSAVQFRQTVLGWSKPGAACRLVFSEGDGLSGLTVDQYDRWLVVQFTSLGLARRREEFARLLAEQLKPEGIYLRTERGIGELEGLELQDSLLWGQAAAAPVLIAEGDIRFLVNLAEGQKTGFYLDQRENRGAVARLAAGRRMLDAFCYTGGFGLHAARAGATSVLGVDISEPALTLAAENARLNALENVSFERGDVFARMQGLQESGAQFDLIVLDPPKFARARNAIEEALRGYRRRQMLALRLLAKGGILVTCCCSGLITMAMLDDLLAQLASEERRDIQVLERRGQSADHPVMATCPESNYLKCLISRAG